MKLLSAIFLFFSSIATLTAQTNTLPNRANIVFGVGQIVQSGFNIEGNIFYRRLAVDYSHGVSLNVSNAMLEEGADKAQGLDIHLPWTTGFGVGYHVNDVINFRVEPKWHQFELYQTGAAQIEANRLGEYTTFTLGLGLYANWLPFKNKESWLKGIMIAPNVRWWPRISSTLENNELRYFNQLTEREEVHTAREIGIGNSPFFYNFSVGYSIEF
ncbi:MAG: hypothetical protein AB8G22_17970 [Saprospiraceae bacterium]